jgi:EmrB/QacA subfamily drug resistance transporter
MDSNPAPHKWLVFLCVALGTFIAYLDSSIVNIALPTLSRYFRADLSMIEWIVTSYLLMITGLVIIFGRVADLYGRRRLYIFGFIVFTLGSVLCGAAPTVGLLILFRCIQGIGAASLLANGAAIVTETFPENERGRALGMVGSVLALGAIVGPLLGGFLTEHVGWRSVFYVNIPVGLVGLLMAIRVLNSPASEREAEGFDFSGAVTLVTLLSCFLFLVNALSTQDRGKAVYLGLLAAVVVLAGVFLVIESRVTHPLVDLSLFLRRAFSAAVASSYLSFWALSSVAFLLPFYLDRGLALSPSQSGYILAPVPAVLVLIAPLGGYLADRIGARTVSTTGALINCLGLAFLSTLSTNTTPLGVVLRLVPFGIGMGFFQPPNNSAIMGAVPPNRIGIASGMISAIKNLGSMSGVAITSLIFTVAQTTVLGRLQAQGIAATVAERDSYVSAVRVMYLFSAAICSVAVVTSLVRGQKPADSSKAPIAAAGD